MIKLNQCPYCGYLGEFHEEKLQMYLPSGLSSGPKMISFWVKCSGCELKTSTVCANEAYGKLSELKQSVIDQWNKITEALKEDE